MQMNRLIVPLAVLFTFMVALVTNAAFAQLPNVDWIDQFGTPGYDRGLGLAIDGAGGIYLAGKVEGSLGGAGSGGAYLRKYDAAGNILWTDQFGTTTTQDSAYGVAVDGSGGVYVSAYLAEGPGVFLRKYDTAGNAQWTKQVSDDGTYRGWGGGVAADTNGGIYVAGTTGTASMFLAKLDAAGNIAWNKQFGAGWTDGYAVTLDGYGGIYVTGRTDGNLGGTSAGGGDAFLRKYNASGDVIWTKQLGTSAFDTGKAVAADESGGIFLVGYTTGNLDGTNAGGYDTFLRKYDASGNVVWADQFGTSGIDLGLGVTVDESGSVFVTGYTSGSLGGEINAGGSDAFIRKYDIAGSVQWTKLIGASSYDFAFASAIDSSERIYTTGETDGSLAGTSAGYRDAYIASFPEPATLSLLALGGLALLRRRKLGR